MRTSVLALLVVLAAAGLVALLLAGGGAVAPAPEGPAGGAAPGEPGGEHLAGRAVPVAQGPSVVAGAVLVRVRDAQGRPAPGVPVEVTRAGDADAASLAPPRSQPGEVGRLSWVEAMDARWAAFRRPAQSPAPDARGVTGDDGTCEILVHRTGAYAVEARPAPPRYGTGDVADVTESAPRPTVHLRVGLGTPLRARVLDAQGRGVAAVLTAWLTGDADCMWGGDETPTDPETGLAVWPAVPEGRIALTVRVPGRLETSAAARVPRDDELVIRLAAGGVVRGRVTDRDGAPVAGARVWATTEGARPGPDGVTPGGTGVAETGADGAYRIEGLPAAPLDRVVVAAHGFAPVSATGADAPWAGAVVAEGTEVVVDLVLGRGSAVEGRVVVEGTDTPVLDATVHCLRTSEAGGGPGASPGAATPDAAGRFRFEGLPVGRYVLIATSPTHFLEALAPSPGGEDSVDWEEWMAARTGAQDRLVQAVIVSDGERLVRDIALRPGLAVRGRVVDLTGAPVGGATVALVGAEEMPLSWAWHVLRAPDLRAPALAAADGTFRIANLPAGEAWRFVARKEGWLGVASDAVRLSPGAPEPEVVLRLGPGASVAGRVLGEDGLPRAGVEVECSPEESSVVDIPSVRSAADGTFRFAGLPAGPVTVSASDDAAEADLHLAPPLADGEARTGVEVRLRPRIELAGVVVDAAGAPVARAQVWVRWAAQGDEGSSNTHTDGDGSFRLRGLVAGEYLIWAAPPGERESKAADVERVRAPARGLRLLCPPGPPARAKGVVAGRVVGPDGAPVPLFKATLQGAKTADTGMGFTVIRWGDDGSSIGGAFRCSTEDPPPWSLRIEDARGSDGRRLNYLPRTVTVPEATADLLVSLDAGLALSGVVLGPGGAPVPGASVRALGAASAVTDATGAFRLEGLAPGDVEVAVRPPEGLRPPPPLRVAAGQADLVLRCTAGAFVSGRVVLPDGNPAAVAGWVNASGVGAQADTQLAEWGTFRLGPLPPDAVVTLEVSLWDAPWRAAPVEGVRAGATDVVVRLEAAAEASGVLVDAHGRPVVGGQVSVGGRGASTDAEGRFRIVGLDPGPAEVTAQRSGGAEAPLSSLDLPAVGVRLVLPPEARVRGRLLGADVGGFTVFLHTAASGRSAETQVGADGAFDLSAFEGAVYGVGARKDGDDRYGWVPAARAGSETAVPLETGLGFEGVVLRPDGQPCAGGVWLWVECGAFALQGSTEADGAFRFRGLPPGPCTLRAWSTRGSGEARAQAGDRSVRLRLDAP